VKRQARPLLDQVLLPFVYAKSEIESEAVLERLIWDFAQPLIRDIVSFKLRAFAPRVTSRDGQELDDLCGEVVLKLIRKLNQLKATPDEAGIASLRGYVASMAYNESDEYVRRKHPRRFSFKNKVRYLLSHNSQFSLWEDGSGSLVCGLGGWGGTGPSTDSSTRLKRIQADADRFIDQRLSGMDIRRVGLDELVEAMLNEAGSPVYLDELVSVAAEMLGIRDPEVQSTGDITETSFGSETPGRAIEDSIDHRARLERIWMEIRSLPPRQRCSLLLNLRDENGDAALALLPMLRIAKIREIAETLEMQAEELAAIWDKLPLEDALIAEQLGTTRQQVINLRKCARERLARRMRTESAG